MMTVIVAILTGIAVSSTIAPFTSCNRDSKDHVVAIVMCNLMIGVPTAVLAWAALKVLS